MNFDQSGQKWEVAPESMIALRCSTGMLICFAMLARSDEANA
jgi:hypothetical protein